jgi:tRNA threonylcarbamoyl adenosine modification protein YeaZ
MIGLILDTSTDLCLLGLAKEDELFAEEVFPHSNLLSKNLLPSIQQLLEKNHLSPSDLSCIALGIGPGSYTGTRLGAAVAKSLAFGLNILVKPFHSPLAFLPKRTGSFAFLIPTRAGSYFVLKNNSARVVPAEALIPEVQEVDLLVGSSLPEGLTEKPRFQPLPNLVELSKFLCNVEGVLPENISLHYLHNPF